MELKNFKWNEANKALINIRTRGTPLLILNKHGYIRVNNTFNIQNKLVGMKYVEVRYVKKEDSFILAFKFLKEKTTDSIKIYEDPNIKSLNFPLTATLKILGFEYKNLKKTLNLKPSIQETEGNKIFISEISKNS